jgi:hypothetical protein
VHPKFKTAWITDDEQKRIGLAFLLSKIQQHVALTNNSASAASEDSANTDIEDDFFFRKDRNMGVTSDNILSGYLSSSISSVSELKLHPIIRNVFLELNTALPASAACEHLFSVAGRVFAPCRTSMSVYCMNIALDENNTAQVREARRQPCQSMQQTVGGA